MEKAVAVAVDFGSAGFRASLDELKELISAAGAETVCEVTAKRHAPDAAHFVGSGKVDEIKQEMFLNGAQIAVFNHALSPAQQRNLEKKLECRVIDRTALILDIFALRAKSAEGKVQVELAQLDHLSTRLVRGWTHLERQKGGIGLRGPGETQLETDRRLIGARVKMLREKLKTLQKQRDTQRKARSRSGTLSVAVAGYTNAGKSTLFNAMTKAGTYAANQLFATLDTTSRRVYIEGAGSVVMSDTVGFIRELPHSLVEAFKATLEETVRADLILHVVDGSNEERREHVESVNAVLAEIGAEKTDQIIVVNKCDLTGVRPAVERDEYGKIGRIFVSAITGDGLDLIRQAIAERVAERNEAARAALEADE